MEGLLRVQRCMVYVIANNVFAASSQNFVVMSIQFDLVVSLLLFILGPPVVIPTLFQLCEM